MNKNHPDYVPEDLPVELHDLYRQTWFRREAARLSNAWEKVSAADNPDAIGIRARELGIHPSRLTRWDKIRLTYKPQGLTQAQIAELENVTLATIKLDFKDMRKRNLI